MVGLYLVGRKVQYDVDPLNILGGVVLLELCIWPTLVVNVSFIMSTIATAGILWLYTPIKTSVQKLFSSARVPDAFVSSVSLSMAASAAVAIPSSIIFESLPLLAVVSNVVVVPLFLALMCSGLLSLTFSVVSTELAEIVALPGEASCNLALSVLELIQSVQPQMPLSSMVIIALLYLVGTVWIIKEGTWLSLSIRSLILMTLIGSLTHLAANEPLGVYFVRNDRGLEVKVLHPTTRSVRFSVRMRNGSVFVRSRDALRPDSTSP